jgi:PIN domain nuclease of toxin-antitoxin system
MKVLLDSHAVYWWTIGSERLASEVRALIEDLTNAALSANATIGIAWSRTSRRLSVTQVETSGGRRHSEIACLRKEQLTVEPPQLSETIPLRP